MFNLEVLNEIKCSILNSSMKNEKAKNFVTKQTDPYVVEGEKFTWWWDECTWCVPGINVPGDGIKASAPKSSPSCSYCMWVDVVKTKNLSISNIITSDKSIKNSKSCLSNTQYYNNYRTLLHASSRCKNQEPAMTSIS